MLLTAEQHAQWQRAIREAYPGPAGMECTLEQWRNYRTADAALLALTPESGRFNFMSDRFHSSPEYLTDRSLPNWILSFRERCVRIAREYSKAALAFRIDVALIGMQLCYATPEAQAESHQRLLLHTLAKVLRPLVERAEADSDRELRQDYEGYFQICQLCESDSFAQEPQRWLAIKNNFGLPARTITNRTRAPHMVTAFTRTVLHTLFQIDESGEVQSLASLLFYMTAEYRECRLDFSLVPWVFLEALEAECPPPDWIS